jgi:hypothetical protein
MLQNRVENWRKTMLKWRLKIDAKIDGKMFKFIATQLINIFINSRRNWSGNSSLLNLICQRFFIKILNIRKWYSDKIVIVIYYKISF